MSFDLNLALNVIYPAQMAAYEIMDKPDPQLPPGYTLIGALEADPARVAELLDANASFKASYSNSAELAEFVRIALSDSRIFGLVAYNATDRTAITAIRGTQTTLEWIRNFTPIPVPFYWAPKLGRIHLGFQLVYATFRASLLALAAKLDPQTRRVLVTGHSLGAALAILAAADLESNQAPPAKPELYTFAGPRAGTSDFAASFPALAPICYRIVNVGDLVPLVPLRLLYPLDFEHVGTQQLVEGGFEIFNPMYAHLMSTYLIGLKKLLPHAG